MQLRTCRENLNFKSDRPILQAEYNQNIIFLTQNLIFYLKDTNFQLKLQIFIYK